MIKDLKKKRGLIDKTKPLDGGRRSTLDTADISAGARNRLATVANIPSSSGATVLCVDIPEVKMCRTMKLPVGLTVAEAIQFIQKRQPLEKPVEEYGLFLPPVPPQIVGEWLQDWQVLANCDIEQGRQVILTPKPPPIVIHFEDGSTKSVWMETALSVSHLINLVLADLPPETREEQLFDYGLYCATDEGQMRNTFFEANPSPQPSSAVLSSSSSLPTSTNDGYSLNATWLDSSAPLARYSELVENNNKKPYLLIWKKKPHYMKVKLHCKMAISKSVKFYYDTTVSEVLKYLETYLTEEEDPAVFSLQENIAQFEIRSLRTKTAPKDQPGELDGEGFWLDDDATIQQFGFVPEDTLNFQIHPRKKAKEKVNSVMIAFDLEPLEQEQSVPAEQLRKNGKRFAFDAETTVRDLLQRIIQFLGDIIGQATIKESECGLFIARKSKTTERTLTGIWLDESIRLSNYFCNKEIQETVTFRKRVKEEEEEPKFHWLTVHVPNRLLQSSPVAASLNPTTSGYLSLRLRKPEETEKIVAIYYKINKTTLAQLLKKLAKRITFPDAPKWYWDPQFYDAEETGVDNGACYGIYLSRQGESHGMWMDRPDAVLSDWDVENGSVMKIVERRRTFIVGEEKQTASLNICVAGFYLNSDEDLEFSFDFSKATRVSEALRAAYQKITGTRKENKAKQERRKESRGERLAQLRQRVSQLSLSIDKGEIPPPPEWNAVAMPSNEPAKSLVPSKRNKRRKIVFEEEEMKWWTSEAIPLLLDGEENEHEAHKDDKSEDHNTHNTHNTHNICNNGWMRRLRLFIPKQVKPLPLSPMTPDDCYLPGSPLSPDRLLVSYPICDLGVVEFGFMVTIQVEWNKALLKIECDIFDKVKSILLALQDKLKAIDPSFTIGSDQALWYNPVNSTNRRSLELSSLPVSVARGFWFDETRRISFYLAKLGQKAGSTLHLQLRPYQASLELELVDGTTLEIPMDYTVPLLTALTDALSDSSYGFIVKTKKLNKILTALQSPTDSVLVYSREKKMPLDLTKSLNENGILSSDSNHLVFVNNSKSPGYERLRARPRSQMIGSKRASSVIGLRRTIFEESKSDPRSLSHSDSSLPVKPGMLLTPPGSPTKEEKEKEKEEENNGSPTTTTTTRWVEIKSARERKKPKSPSVRNSAARKGGELLILAAGGGSDENLTGEALGVPLWDEDEDSTANIMLTRENETVKLVAASLNKLIIKMTSKDEYDHKWVNTFLLTYQSFTTSGVLLHKLIERYMVPKPKTPTFETKEWEMTVKKIQYRVCNVVNQWLETSFEDFNSKLISKLERFIVTCIKRDHPPLAAKLEKTLHKKLAHVKPKGNRIFTQPPPSPKVPSNLYSTSLNFFDISDEEIARQLTLIDHKLFSAIKPKELLSLGWLKPEHSVQCPNVLAMINRFNELSGWVATMIVKVELINNRVKMYTKMISIAQYLRDLGNFSALMSFIAGWNTSPILRMKLTHKELPKKFAELKIDLEATMASEFSYRAYRASLHSVDPPCVPYLGVHLQDLVFIDEGNPDTIGENKLINFTKRELVSNVILELQQYKQKPYNLTTVSRIASLFAELPHKNTDELYDLSLQREPRQK